MTRHRRPPTDHDLAMIRAFAGVLAIGIYHDQADLDAAPAHVRYAHGLAHWRLRQPTAVPAEHRAPIAGVVATVCSR